MPNTAPEENEESGQSEAKPTITIAEKSGSQESESAEKDTITIAEKDTITIAEKDKPKNP